MPTIQDMITRVAGDYYSIGYFSINFIRIDVLLLYGIPLSYKQTRDALYRMRGYSGWYHTRRGRYRFAGCNAPRYAIGAGLYCAKVRILASAACLTGL